MRANLLAIATTTTFFGARASSASSQAPIGARSGLIRNTTARAPWMRILRKYKVAAFADAEQSRLASSRILSWHDSQPRGKVASLPKSCAVADGSDDGRGHNRPDPWNLPDASAARVRGGDPFQLEAESINLDFDCLPLVPKKTDQVRICVVRPRSVFSRTSGKPARSLAGVSAKTGPRSIRTHAVG